jgi:cysteine-rich secretory family protein
MRRWKAFAAATVLVATLGTAVSASAQSSSEESRFVALINQLRASKGVAALVVDGGLASTSCGWTDHMVAVATLGHDPNLAGAVSSVETAWTKAGENVGVGGDVDLLFNAFVASAAHYKNLVDPAFTAIGVCVTWTADHSRMYTTHRFVANGSVAPPPAVAPAVVAAAPAPPPPPTEPPTVPPTEPPTTVPPTTEPPTTTTVAPAIAVDALVPVASNALTAGVLVAIAQSTD